MLRKNIFRLSEQASANVSDVVGANTPSGMPYKITVANLLKNAGLPAQIRYVSAKSDFPAPVSGVITAAANTTYIVTTAVDLAGDRIVMSSGSSIVGLGLNRSVLSSTGLTGAIVTFTQSTQFNEMAFNVAANQVGARCLGAAANVNLLCYQVAFSTAAATAKGVEVPTGQTMGALLFDTCQTIGPGIGVEIGGTVTNFAGSDSAYTSATGIRTLPGSVITARLRNYFCIADNSTFALDASMTVPNESVIFNNCIFGGTSTITGLTIPLKVKITDCTGNISNNPSVGTMRMTGNATATTIAVAGTYVKALGATTGGTLIRYSHTPSNRLTYDGLQSGLQKVTMIASLTQSGGGTPTLSIGIAFNGVLQADSTFDATTDGSGRAEVISTAYVTNVQQTNYFELFVTNKTNTSSVTVTQMTVIVEVL